MKDEKMDELVTRYHEALPKRIHDYLQDSSQSILIIYKIEFGRFILRSKGIPVVNSMGAL